MISACKVNVFFNMMVKNLSLFSNIMQKIMLFVDFFLFFIEKQTAFWHLPLSSAPLPLPSCPVPQL